LEALCHGSLSRTRTALHNYQICFVRALNSSLVGIKNRLLFVSATIESLELSQFAATARGLAHFNGGGGYIYNRPGLRSFFDWFSRL
jgi:hypothetical protein